MKILNLILLMFTCSQIVFAGEVISEREFTIRYIESVQGKFPGVQSKITADLEVEFTSSGGKEMQSYLRNAYSNYKASPNDLKNILDEYSDAYSELEVSDNLSYGKDRIFPVLKDYEYIRQVGDLFKKQGKGDEIPFVYEKLNDVLYVLYAFDTETSIKFLTHDDIDRFELDITDLRKISKENLKSYLPNIQVQGDPSFVSMLVADGTYEASFLLFEDLWTKEQFPVKGDIVIYVPSRDLVLITGSEDTEGLAKVRDIVYDPSKEWPYIVAEVGFIRSGNKWKVFNM